VRSPRSGQCFDGSRSAPCALCRLDLGNPDGALRSRLAQGPETVPDPTVGQHDLKAEHKVTRHATAEHIEAARIRGNIAADPSGALRAECYRQQAFLGVGGLLGDLEEAEH
jgi:hypothetical protein